MYTYTIYRYYRYYIRGLAGLAAIGPIGAMGGMEALPGRAAYILYYSTSYSLRRLRLASCLLRLTTHCPACSLPMVRAGDDGGKNA